MKYQVSTGAAPAAKKFDFDKAMESLTATYERLGEASENLLAVDASLAEVSQVMEDCGSALKSIQTFGVAKENMSLLNGSNNALDDALGLEHLDINAIESLSDSTKKALKKSYEAGLEGVISDAWDKFVAFLKKMWGGGQALLHRAVQSRRQDEASHRRAHQVEGHQQDRRGCDRSGWLRQGD